MALGGLFLSFVAVGIFVELGLKGFILPLLLLIFLFPGMVLAHGLLLFLIPPTYVRRQPTVTTLFRR
jgi:ABC-type Fe3+ transport system permease subunit